MGIHTPMPTDLAIRLADEGVPLRAIARAVSLPSELIRERLLAAQASGQLFELPRDDWPPGFPRDQRSLQIARMVSENRDLVQQAAAQVFALTTMEVRLFLSLLQAPHVSREHPHVGGKVMDVRIHNMRNKLKSFDISIETLWGYGYQLSPADRRKAADLILARVADVPCL